MCSYTVTLWYLQWTVVWTECVGASPLRECVPSVRMKSWSFWRACRRRTWFLWTYSDICTTSMKTQAKVETASHTSNAPNVGSIDVYFASFYVQRLVQILAETILPCIHVYNLIVWRHHFQLWICKQVILCFHYKYRYCGVDFSVILYMVSDFCFTLQVSQCQTWVTRSSPRHSSTTVTTGDSFTSSRPSSVCTNWCYPLLHTCLGFSYRSGKCPGPKSFLSASCWG